MATRPWHMLGTTFRPLRSLGSRWGLLHSMSSTSSSSFSLDGPVFSLFRLIARISAQCGVGWAKANTCLWTRLGDVGLLVLRNALGPQRAIGSGLRRSVEPLVIDHTCSCNPGATAPSIDGAAVCISELPRPRARCEQQAFVAEICLCRRTIEWGRVCHKSRGRHFCLALLHSAQPMLRRLGAVANTRIASE